MLLASYLGAGRLHMDQRWPEEPDRPILVLVAGKNTSADFDDRRRIQSSMVVWYLIIIFV